jgi:hypothetical protein
MFAKLFGIESWGFRNQLIGVVSRKRKEGV